MENRPWLIPTSPKIEVFLQITQSLHTNIYKEFKLLPLLEVTGWRGSGCRSSCSCWRNTEFLGVKPEFAVCQAHGTFIILLSFPRAATPRALLTGSFGCCCCKKQRFKTSFSSSQTHRGRSWACHMFLKENCKGEKKSERELLIFVFSF